MIFYRKITVPALCKRSLKNCSFKCRHSLGSREALDRKEAGINKKLDEIKETVDEIKANQLKVDDIVKVNRENVKREIIHELAVSIVFMNIINII